jgi:hypothetical protein
MATSCRWTEVLPVRSSCNGALGRSHRTSSPVQKLGKVCLEGALSKSAEATGRFAFCCRARIGSGWSSGQRQGFLKGKPGGQLGSGIGLRLGVARPVSSGRHRKSRVLAELDSQASAAAERRDGSLDKLGNELEAEQAEHPGATPNNRNRGTFNANNTQTAAGARFQSGESIDRDLDSPFPFTPPGAFLKKSAAPRVAEDPTSLPGLDVLEGIFDPKPKWRRSKAVLSEETDGPSLDVLEQLLADDGPYPDNQDADIRQVDNPNDEEVNEGRLRVGGQNGGVSCGDCGGREVKVDGLDVGGPKKSRLEAGSPNLSGHDVGSPNVGGVESGDWKRLETTNGDPASAREKDGWSYSALEMALRTASEKGDVLSKMQAGHKAKTDPSFEALIDPAAAALFVEDGRTERLPIEEVLGEAVRGFVKPPEEKKPVAEKETVSAPRVGARVKGSGAHGGRVLEKRGGSTEGAGVPGVWGQWLNSVGNRASKGPEALEKDRNARGDLRVSNQGSDLSSLGSLRGEPSGENGRGQGNGFRQTRRGVQDGVTDRLGRGWSSDEDNGLQQEKVGRARRTKAGGQFESDSLEESSQWTRQLEYEKLSPSELFGEEPFEVFARKTQTDGSISDAGGKAYSRERSGGVRRGAEMEGGGWTESGMEIWGGAGRNDGLVRGPWEEVADGNGVESVSELGGMHEELLVEGGNYGGEVEGMRKLVESLDGRGSSKGRADASKGGGRSADSMGSESGTSRKRGLESGVGGVQSVSQFKAVPEEDGIESRLGNGFDAQQGFAEKGSRADALLDGGRRSQGAEVSNSERRGVLARGGASRGTERAQPRVDASFDEERGAENGNRRGTKVPVGAETTRERGGVEDAKERAWAAWQEFNAEGNRTPQEMDRFFSQWAAESVAQLGGSASNRGRGKSRETEGGVGYEGYNTGGEDSRAPRPVSAKAGHGKGSAESQSYLDGRQAERPGVGPSYERAEGSEVQRSGEKWTAPKSPRQGPSYGAPPGRSTGQVRREEQAGSTDPGRSPWVRGAGRADVSRGPAGIADVSTAPEGARQGDESGAADVSRARRGVLAAGADVSGAAEEGWGVNEGADPDWVGEGDQPVADTWLDEEEDEEEDFVQPVKFTPPESLEVSKLWELKRFRRVVKGGGPPQS